jgi:anaerobic selenocysteine-containing dehydrogenase
MLKTTSGRIELMPPELLAEGEALAQALGAAPPELVVVGRREVRNNNSWMHNLPLLAKGPERCTLRVHPADAARAGLAEGDWAWLRSAHGALRVPVQLSDTLREGVVSLPHGFGHELPGVRLSVAAEKPGANLNALLPLGERDPLSGNAVLSGVAVSLTAA